MSVPDETTGIKQAVKAGGRAALDSARIAAECAVVLLAAIWVVQGVNVVDGYGLDTTFGLRGRTLSSLPDILTSPFLHVSMQHIESNSIPLAVLTFVAALGGLRRFITALALIVVLGGLGTWLLTPSSTYEVGASGMIFGLLGFVTVRGLFARTAWQRVWQVALGGLVFVYYFWALRLLYPNAVVNAMHISWQGHLCGFIAGIFAAYYGWRRERGRPLPDATVPPHAFP